MVLKSINKSRIMNEEKIKELFGVNYLRLLAEYTGYYGTLPGQDYGTDLHIEEMQRLPTGEYIPSGRIISLQIKCTTEESITETDKHLKYDLAIRNHKLLIQRQFHRQALPQYNPYLLILVVLPKAKVEWLQSLKNGHLELSARAFWYMPNELNQFSDNKFSKRIAIPLENLVDLEVYPKLFNLLWTKKI